METLDPSMAQQIAQAAIAFQYERTGHEPMSVDVVLSGEILLITMDGALSPAEKTLAKNPEGAARVQAFYRKLFTNSADTLRQEIKRVTGVQVREATAKGEATRGTMVQLFTTGTIMLVFLLARCVTAGNWSGKRPVQPLESAPEGRLTENEQGPAKEPNYVRQELRGRSLCSSRQS
jgi:uncharacterized protein YbcI